MEWRYLYSESFKVRQVIASHYLKECTEVLEIGGYRCPVGDFLSDRQRVAMLDPKCIPFESETRRYLPIQFQDWNEQMPDGFGLAILGLELHLEEENWNKLFSLINRSKICVIEWATDFAIAATQIKRILDGIRRQKIFHVQLDLSLAPLPVMTDSAPPYFRRDIIVFA